MNLSAFLSSSSLAKRIKLPSRVVVSREALSPREVLVINEKGRYEYEAPRQEFCDLEVNGEVIARGKIVRKAGKFFFKVLEMNQGSERPGKESAK